MKRHSHRSYGMGGGGTGRGSAGNRAGTAGVDRRHDTGQLRRRVAGRHRRSPQPVAGRRGEHGQRSSGTYRFPALRPGRYEVTATLQGFQPAKQSDVRLELGQILKIDLAMGIGALAETVKVTGESPLIDVKQNTAGANVQAEIIERIPKGRDFATSSRRPPASPTKPGIAVSRSTAPAAPTTAS